MRAHYIQHVPFEGLGSIEEWLKNNGYSISCSQLFQSAVFPNCDDFDLLIIMGGPMSVNDETDYPWLVQEKQFIRATIDAGKPVIGICLGAQLIANSLGSKVYPNPVKEIGWYPIQSVKTEKREVFKFPDRVDVFHWHGETFSLPNDAIRIAESEGCKNQAFQVGHNIIGLQFHLETTPESAKAIVENCSDELIDGQYIQSETEILSTPAGRYASINNLMKNILDHLLRAC
jgi:GMP synthase-like glutamine amidotransferase